MTVKAGTLCTSIPKHLLKMHRFNCFDIFISSFLHFYTSLKRGSVAQ